ncbi:MAG: hypothetical protein Kow00122_16540 [Thermoleophilia bacterium]
MRPRRGNDLDSYFGARVARRLTSGANAVLERHPWAVPGAVLVIGLVSVAGGVLLGRSSDPAVTNVAGLVLFPLGATCLLFGAAGLVSAVIVHSVRRKDQ